MSDEQSNTPGDQPEEPQGRAKGGKARAESLSDTEKHEIARKAALARWGARATHKGNFKADFGIDVDCYVLNDENKTAVVSQRGMGEALGLGQGGSRVHRLIRNSRISPYIGPELREKLENPLVFQGQPAGPNIPPQRIFGYDVTILIDVCKAVVEAEVNERLGERQRNIARQAHVILSASAKAGIKGLVYALSGYDATKEEVIAAFKMYVREEAREYEREFSDQLYQQWYRLYQLPKPERNRPWKFKHLTLNQVYHPLARSNGQILKLAQLKRASGAERWKRLHQFLSEIGVKALRTHLGQLLGIAQVSKNKEEYEQYIANVFGGQLDLEWSEH